MTDPYTIVAEDSDAGERLDKFLSRRLPELSRSRLQALIAQGCVASLDVTVTDASRKVKPQEIFRVTIPETVPSHIEAQDIPLDIIYEDAHLLVINKPPGLTVHPAPGHRDMTLVNALLSHCGDSLSGIGGVARPGIVHRIDKDTSGLLVVAKHDDAHHHLSAQLAARTLKRTYNAVVWGALSPASGTIKGNIGRSLSNRQKMAVVPRGGKEATTHYKVVTSGEWLVAREKNHSSLAARHSPLFSLLECNLETGRTHQIRVHLTHIGHPLIGDPVYGAATKTRLNNNLYKSLSEKTRAALLNFNRQALHAKALTLIHPATEKTLNFEASMPEDMRELLEKISAAY